MDKFFISQQVKSKNFADKFLDLIKSNNYNTVVIISQDSINNQVNHLQYQLPESIKIENEIAITRAINLLKEYFILGYKKNSLFVICQQVFPLIEIILEDFNDVDTISSWEVAESNISFLKGKIFEIVLDLVQNKYAQTNINIYYREAEIKKFKFHCFPIDEDLNKIKITNCIKNYFQNIRALLACLLCQIFYYIQTIKVKCGEFIIKDRKEIYYGTIQQLRSPDISLLMRNVDPYKILDSFRYMSVSNIDSRKCLKSDMEIFLWTNFMANIQPHLEILESYESIRMDIEKFYILIAYSYSNYLSIEENNNSLTNTNINHINQNPPNTIDKHLMIELITECFNIIKSEPQQNRKLTDWIIYNILKIFHFNRLVSFFLLGEILNQTIISLSEKSETLNSKNKMQELYKTSERRNLNENEIKNLIETLQNDISWLTNTVKFLLHTSWMDEQVKDVKNLYVDLQERKIKLNLFLYKLKSVLRKQ